MNSEQIHQRQCELTEQLDKLMEEIKELNQMENCEQDIELFAIVTHHRHISNLVEDHSDCFKSAYLMGHPQRLAYGLAQLAREEVDVTTVLTLSIVLL